MDYVVGGEQKANFGVYRHHQGMVNFQQIIGHGFRINATAGLTRQITFSIQRA